MATSSPAFQALSSMPSLSIFVFPSEVHPVALGRVEGPDSGAGWCQLLGADWLEVFVPCTL